jgi:hypothetical protein
VGGVLPRETGGRQQSMYGILSMAQLVCKGTRTHHMHVCVRMCGKANPLQVARHS